MEDWRFNGLASSTGGPTIRERLLAQPDWEQIAAQLISGRSSGRLARELIKRPSLSDLKSGSIRRLLNRIQKRVIVGMIPALEDEGQVTTPWREGLPIQLRRIMERLRGVPEIRRLEAVVMKQMLRVEAGLKLERDSSVLLPGIHDEIELLWKMASSVVEIKQKLGLLHTEPIKLHTLLDDLRGGSGRQMLDPESRQRVREVLNEFRRRMALPGPEDMDEDHGGQKIDVTDG